MPYNHSGRDTQYRSASVLLVIEAVYVRIMDAPCRGYLIETFGLLEKDVAGKAVSDHHIGTVCGEKAVRLYVAYETVIL